MATTYSIYYILEALLDPQHVQAFRMPIQWRLYLLLPTKQYPLFHYLVHLLKAKKYPLRQLEKHDNNYGVQDFLHHIVHYFVFLKYRAHL